MIKIIFQHWAIWQILSFMERSSSGKVIHSKIDIANFFHHFLIWFQRDWRVINHVLSSPRYEMAVASIPVSQVGVSFWHLTKIFSWEWNEIRYFEHEHKNLEDNILYPQDFHFLVSLEYFFVIYACSHYTGTLRQLQVPKGEISASRGNFEAKLCAKFFHALN